MNEKEFKKFITEQNARIKDFNLRNNPLISVIIPTYNRLEYLKQAVASVLSQTYKNVEIIIIDDNSENEVIMALKQYQRNLPEIKIVFRDKNMGPGINRKYGYSLAKGDYLIFLDDDDFYTNIHFFNHAINYLENYENTRVSFYASSAIIYYVVDNLYIPQKINKAGFVPAENYLKGFQYIIEKPKSTFTTVFRKRSLEISKINKMEILNDTTIYLRSLLSSEGAFLSEEYSGVYRVHNKNIAQNISKGFKYYEHIIKNLLEKYRIYQELKNKYRWSDEWMINQSMVTIKYMLYCSDMSYLSYKKIIAWMDTIENNIAIRIKFKTTYHYYKAMFIRKIKKLIKNKNQN